MERARLGPGRHGRLEHLRAEQPAGVDHRLARVQAEAARERLDDIVRDGEHDELDVVHERVRLGEGADPRDELAEPLAPGRVARRDRAHGPARPRQRDAEGRPDRARADDPHDRPLARAGVRVRVDVVARVLEVAVAVGRPGLAGPGLRIGRLAHRLPAGARPRGGIEVDAVVLQVLERLLVLLRATLGLALEHLLGLVPGPHPAPPSARAGALYASTQRV